MGAGGWGEGWEEGRGGRRVETHNAQRAVGLRHTTSWVQRSLGEGRCDVELRSHTICTPALKPRSGRGRDGRRCCSSPLRRAARKKRRACRVRGSSGFGGEQLSRPTGCRGSSGFGEQLSRFRTTRFCWCGFRRGFRPLGFRPLGFRRGGRFRLCRAGLGFRRRFGGGRLRRRGWPSWRGGRRSRATCCSDEDPGSAQGEEGSERGCEKIARGNAPRQARSSSPRSPSRWTCGAP